MKKLRVGAGVAVMAGLVGLVGAAMAAGQEPGDGGEVPAPPSEPLDLGAGERLLLVVGGAFPTTGEADAEAAAMRFGELQGYYAAPVGQFEGLDEFLGVPVDHTVLVSAFRTQEGASEFVGLASAAGAPALVTPRLLNRGDVYVGLGQEAAPDGSGPLRGPIPGVTTP